MTKIAVWCRHEHDCIIGIGPNIPWNIPSDLKRFRRITSHADIVCGQTTYESFPNRTLPNRQIYVLTFNTGYEVSDKDNHFVINDMMQLQNFPRNLYIAGGASIYKAFMRQMPPEVIVDSCNHNEISGTYSGNPVDIKECIDIMMQDYEQVSPEYNEDNVTTTLWVRKGALVNDDVLRYLTLAITEEK
ncbi:MAG: dihydrofolate reductase [Alphaproteobacteria bacterium]|nr:dihydrofolate reductase [Alphaproteobacteria bacterium]